MIARNEYLENLIHFKDKQLIRQKDIRQYLKTGDKYYAAGIGLRYSVLGSKKADDGHILENMGEI